MSPPPGPFDDELFDDELFDVDAVAAGAWVPGPYGPGDELGTYNEVTPQKSAAALATLAGAEAVRTFHLGETLFEDFPAFGDRPYRQRLLVTGYQPPDGFEGILRRARPLGANRLSYHEERVTTTYNLGSKINGLLHCGVGSMFYNGFTGDRLARTWGAAHLDTVSWGPPIVTRGFLVDGPRGSRGRAGVRVGRRAPGARRQPPHHPRGAAGCPRSARSAAVRAR